MCWRRRTKQGRPSSSMHDSMEILAGAANEFPSSYRLQPDFPMIGFGTLRKPCPDTNRVDALRLELSLFLHHCLTVVWRSIMACSQAPSPPVHSRQEILVKTLCRVLMSGELML